MTSKLPARHCTAMYPSNTQIGAWEVSSLVSIFLRLGLEDTDWSSNSGSGWNQVDKPEPKLQNQQEMRNKGAQRTQNFSSMRGARMGGGGRRR